MTNTGEKNGILIYLELLILKLNSINLRLSQKTSLLLIASLWQIDYFLPACGTGKFLSYPPVPGSALPLEGTGRSLEKQKFLSWVSTLVFVLLLLSCKKIPS